MEKERNKQSPKIKIISIGQPSIPFEDFDAPVIPLTLAQEEQIKKSVEKAFKEMQDFEQDED